MLRYAFACRGEPKQGKTEISIAEEQLDITKAEQFTEHYLCDVNVNGEVPVLILEDGKPLPDSVEISLLLAQSYPRLAPEGCRADIERYLRELHKINFFSLTFTGKPERQLAGKEWLNERLKEDISPKYREAIEHKLKRIDETKLAGLTDDQVKGNISMAEALMRDFEAILKESNTDWCFSLDQPSVLDAHLIVFICRMQDVRRDNLIPETLRQYAGNAMEGEAWKSVMKGRRTMPPGF